jgi:hypothetical protein
LGALQVLDLELEALRARDAHGLYLGLSLALRRFLAALLSIPALERTTREIDGSLREQRLEANVRARLVATLRDCDRVKFGGAEADDLRAGRERLRDSVTLARQLVRLPRSSETIPSLSSRRG